MKYSLRQSGFTLIELMITVAIIGIIASMAAPAMTEQIASMRHKETVNLLENALRQARTDALIYRIDIAVTIDNVKKTITTTSARKGTATVVQNYNKNTNITKIDGVGAMKVTFNPAKTANASTFGVCYANRKSQRPSVTVNQTANISTSITATKECQ